MSLSFIVQVKDQLKLKQLKFHNLTDVSEMQSKVKRGYKEATGYFLENLIPDFLFYDKRK